MSLEASLAKIRPHTTSSLLHQKAPANLLVALESAFVDQNTEKTPTAYFAALLVTLESSQSKLSFGDGDLLPAILYLLALVAPHVPASVIRSRTSTILSLLVPLFPSLAPHAPPLRSQLTLFNAIIKALDGTQLDLTPIRQSFSFILELTLDSRPKVRKKAAELVVDVLASPLPPLLKHPYSDRVGEWAASTMDNIVSGAGNFGGKGKDVEGNNAIDAGIHLVTLLKQIVPYLPTPRLLVLTPTLLSSSHLGNPYLAESSYKLLSVLISDVVPMANRAAIISTLLASSPDNPDSVQSPAWLDLLATAFSSNIPVSLTHKEIESGFKTAFTYLEASQLATRNSASRALASILTNTVTPSLVEEALAGRNPKKPGSLLSKLVTHVRTSFDSLAYARAVPQMLFVLGAFLRALRHRSEPTSPTAAEVFLLDLVLEVGETRIKKGYEYKEAADEVLKVAMSVLGPEVILRVLPLGLIPEDREKDREPHAYLLPLLAVPHPAPLAHFIHYFVPLSERMFDLQQSAEGGGRVHEAKMWDVLVGQVWTGFIGYCYGTRDLVESFNPTFAQLMSRILYNHPTLRPSVLRALKTIVESNAALASGIQPAWATTDTISSAEAAQNVAHLRSQSESWFAVLFNVFGTVDRDSRGPVGEAITAWVEIAGDEEVANMYKKIVDLLDQNLTGSGGSGTPELALTAQELLVLLLPKLPIGECSKLWTLCTSDVILRSSNVGVQKHGYRILTRLVQGGKISSVLDAENVLKRLRSLADATSASAKRERINLLASLLPLLPSTSLHIIPNLIPEAVLATKEPAERSRSAAFDLIVAMGRKMQEGGVVSRDRIDGMEEDMATAGEVQASMEEYLTMIAAGLVGATPHMISASITAVSRLVFEFKEDMSSEMLHEILSTLFVFVSSANREIVKSALGFVKLAVHTLPIEAVSPYLQQLVSALLGWVGDHKNHFKMKVRHIFERMIRRFGWDAVYSCVGNGAEAMERGKVLLNIKKRKDRAKRKKARNADEEEGEDEESRTLKTGDAFEDVLYGGESEVEDSDDDTVSGPSRVRRTVKGVRLRVDNDEPMDLRHSLAGNFIESTAIGRRKPGEDAAHFSIDETGRMIIDGDEEDNADDAMDDTGGAAYTEAITSTDGFTRGARGRLKFNKDTKKRRRANEEQDNDEDVDMKDVGTTNAPNKNKKRKKDARLGQEFKAKNAGGDVKKGGMDPYAYLPLSQASKKGRKGSDISLIGRR